MKKVGVDLLFSSQSLLIGTLRSEVGCESAKQDWSFLKIADAVDGKSSSSLLSSSHSARHMLEWNELTWMVMFCLHQYPRAVEVADNWQWVMDTVVPNIYWFQQTTDISPDIVETELIAFCGLRPEQYVHIQLRRLYRLLSIRGIAVPPKCLSGCAWAGVVNTSGLSNEQLAFDPDASPASSPPGTD